MINVEPVVIKARNASFEDVNVAFQILLGRPCGGIEDAQVHIGNSIIDLWRGIAGSEEFAALMNEVMHREHLYRHDDCLDEKDLARANEYMSEYLEGTKWTASNWWALLLAILNAKGVSKNSARDSMTRRLMALCRRRMQDIGSVADRLRSILTFDAQWFRRHCNALQVGHTLGFHAHVTGEEEQELIRFIKEKGISPFAPFTDGLGRAFESLTADDTISDLRELFFIDAIDGHLSHWLFDAPAYGRSLLAAPKRISDETTLRKTPYIHFLLSGDQQGQTPHPLFSPFTYGRLNGISAPDFERGAFIHYLLNGIYNNLPTSVIFDSDYYLEMNPSVRAEISKGAYLAPLHHFLRSGMAMGLPFSPDFDREFYLQRYPDVSQAVRDRVMPSAEWHFVHHGLHDNLQPNPYFDPLYYGENYPESRSELTEFRIGSYLEHFLQIGRKKGYRASRPLVATAPDMKAGKAIFERQARRAFFDIMEKGLRFPETDRGRTSLSIVVPIYDQGDFTALFLKNAFFADAYLRGCSNTGIEIVLVNNGSSDHTARLLQRVKGIRVVTFDKPIGFPKAVNEGVAVSKGRTIVIANNDISFAPDIFARLIEVLDKNPTYGAVGAKIILPNETLQEFGSFVAENGSCCGYARGESPWSASTVSMLEADFASGCFLAIRRADFDALGGLDEIFYPGYYEEADLCIRMLRQLGKRTLVHPDVVITHYEHASFAKGRPIQSSLAGILRNREVFRRRHAGYIVEKPAHEAFVTAAGLRPGVSRRPRVLVVEDLMPDERLGSGFGRCAAVLHQLAASGVAFDLLVLHSNATVTEFADPRIVVYKAWTQGEDLSTVLRERGSLYSCIWICRTHNLRRYDLDLNAHKRTWGGKVVCDTEALVATRDAEIARLNGAEISREQLLRNVGVELQSTTKVDLFIAVSHYEQRLMQDSGVWATAVIGHHIDIGKQTPGRALRDKKRILAVGAVHSADSPNHDGLEWFLTRVIPKLPPVAADYTLTIVGPWSAKVQEAFLKRHAQIAFPIEFLGVVSTERLRELYDESRIAIAPTRFAAGIPCKAIEAMLLGTPIVLSDYLAQQLGISEDDRQRLAIGQRFDDGASFAEALTKLLNNDDWLNSVVKQQHRIAQGIASASVFQSATDAVVNALELSTTR